MNEWTQSAVHKSCRAIISYSQRYGVGRSLAWLLLSWVVVKTPGRTTEPSNHQNW